MKPVNISALSCNLTANFTGNFSSRTQQIPPPNRPMVNPYDEFFKFAFGSAIYLIIVSLISIVANGLLLLIFFFDPLKIFRNATTCFLFGLAVLDILVAIQESMYATCFLMMYSKHRDTLTTCRTLLTAGQWVFTAAMTASSLLVLAFTITQYIVVISPLNHARKVTKTRVIICVLAIYLYAILFSVLPNMGVQEYIHRAIDNIFHGMILMYVTVIFYILLYRAFRKKMATSENLQKSSQVETKNGREQKLQRNFIIVNFLLMFILIFCLQPSAILWTARRYSKENPNSPKVLILNLMVDNLLYLKFLLDPFVYAWRIPRYRQALKIVLRCGRDEPEAKFSSRDMAKRRKSRDTVIALDLKHISQE